MHTYLEAPGALVEPGELQLPKAQALVTTLQLARLAFCAYIESRREAEGVEVIVVDVDVERGQRTVHDIRFVERIAVRFFPEDQRIPEALALRSDFPFVPHLNLRVQPFPRSLCLYDVSYDELKMSWTAARFIERIRTWLAQTARGELHAEDQPLEPLLMGSAAWLVLPAELYENPFAPQPQQLMLTEVKTTAGQVAYIARDTDDPRQRGGLACVATVIVGKPQLHGIVHRLPETLYDLHTYLVDAGLDLIAALRDRLREWQQTGKAQPILEYRLILIVVLPKTRTAGGAVEASDIYALVSLEALGFVGEHLGVWQRCDDAIGAVIGVTPQADKVKLVMLNPTPALSRERAALLSGRGDTDATALTAVGAGALGSQVITNLLRMGYGPWAVIDNDIMLPHNLARHALYGWAVGQAKAEALAASAWMTLNDRSVVKPIVADVLHRSDRDEEVRQALTETTLVLDMSASVGVARVLACDTSSSSRRASLFLNPSGQDLVLLAEDTDRTTPLDVVEMQYYRLIVQEPALHEHLRAPGLSLRYARSCRDVSATIPQDLVALHAAIGSRSIRALLEDPGASLTVWQTDAVTLAVAPICRTPTPAMSYNVSGWTIWTDSALQQALHEQREARLPRETGGVLLGSIDLQRQHIYVVLSLPSPPDSIEWPTSYVRGCAGLLREVEWIEQITAGQLTYVGEWHSHPHGHSCKPSATDRRAIAQLAAVRASDGLPALMGIVGDQEWEWVIGQL